MSTFSLTTIQDAAVALTTGKLNKVEFIAWASSRQTEMPALLSLMGKGLDLVDVSSIISAQQALVAKAAPQAAGVRCKTSKRGAVSVYGLNSRMPVTLYAGQWERFLEYVKAEKDNPIAKHIAADTAQEFPLSDLKMDDDKTLLAEVLAGKHPHASIKGDKLVCKISRKA